MRAILCHLTFNVAILSPLPCVILRMNGELFVGKIFSCSQNLLICDVSNQLLYCYYIMSWYVWYVIMAWHDLTFDMSLWDMDMESPPLLQSVLQGPPSSQWKISLSFVLKPSHTSCDSSTMLQLVLKPISENQNFLHWNLKLAMKYIHSSDRLFLFYLSLNEELKGVFKY